MAWSLGPSASSGNTGINSLWSPGPWGYYGAPFKVFSGVTQGDPLSPTIFNLVVDKVLQNWVTVVASTEESVDPGAAGKEGFGRDVQQLEAYF